MAAPQTTNPNITDRDTTLNISRFVAMFGSKKTGDEESGPGNRETPVIQGYAYIILQVIRFCNVAVLLAVMVASVLMLIFAKLPNGYQFFGDVVHAIVFFFAALLIFTEIGLWKKGQAFVASAWPMLGPDRGFTGLGTIMVVIGCHLLGGLSTNTYTSRGVPSQIPQLIIGAGIISLAFGVANILASILFRNDKVRAREVREAGATTRDFVINDNVARSNSARKAEISGPMPIHDQFAPGTGNYYNENKSVSSFDSRHSPIVPEVTRPPTVLHPMNRTSHYSEASNMDRFM